MKQVAEMVKGMALREAKRSVGKSMVLGTHEVKVPQELLKAELKSMD